MRHPDGTDRDDDPTFYYAKVGYRAKWFEIGESRFSVDYQYVEDLAQDGDEAKTVGFQFVQDIPGMGFGILSGLSLA